MIPIPPTIPIRQPLWQLICRSWINSRHATAIHWTPPGFSFIADNIEIGSNIITVIGFDGSGHSASNTTVIYRKTLAEAQPQIAVDALLYPTNNAVVYPYPTPWVIWDPAKITDDTDGTNLLLSKITVYNADTLQYLFDTAINISNINGKATMRIPVSFRKIKSDCVIRFEVVDSGSVTNSLIFNNKRFRVGENGMLLFIRYH